MKNLLTIILVALIATTFSFAEVANVNDNITTGKTGTGSFICTVINPLTISTNTTAFNLGEFVVSATPYTGPTYLTNNVMTFNVNGQNSHSFFYNITEDEGDALTDNATVVIDWTNGATPLTTGSTQTANLPLTGPYVITATVSSLTALVSGPATFAQSVTVSYNTF